MTLLELLEEAARREDCVWPGCSDGPKPCPKNQNAAALREAAARLRSEMERARDAPAESVRGSHTRVSLERINGGPLK